MYTPSKERSETMVYNRCGGSFPRKNWQKSTDFQILLVLEVNKINFILKNIAIRRNS